MAKMNVYIGWENARRTEEKMDDLVILHLSDLHIDAKSSKNYSNLLKGLLNDIKNEINMAQDESVVIAVTGDTLHRGDRDAVPAAIKFFGDLYKIVKEKFAAIYIVPGNHDKMRTKENNFLIPGYRLMNANLEDKFGDEFYETFWKYHDETYSSEKGSGYHELIKKVYEIYGVKDFKNKEYIKDTFGVDVIDVLGKKYCFVMLNTAWSCLDENDTRQLILGKFQIEKIKKQYHELVDNLTGNGVELTLVLGHHPIGALYGKEEDSLFTEMISFEELNANAYLCGHTHDRTIINWVNNRHSINTFMTGIGWPESNSGYHIGTHTYSMYVFNIDANSIDIYVRSTDDGGEFNPDFRIYTNANYRNNKKIVFPIKAEKAQTYISLDVGPCRPSKACYISDEFLEYIREYVLRIGQFRQSAGIMIEADKSELYERIPNLKELSLADTDGFYSEADEYDEDEILYNYFFADVKGGSDDDLVEKTVNKIFSQYSNIRHDMFLGFLQRICQKLQRILLYDKMDKDDIVRFHFRYLSDRGLYIYPRLCASFPERINPVEHELSDIKYGELIDAAFKTGKGLVYSVNKSFCKNKLKDKWANFLTVIPLFDGNLYKRRYFEAEEKRVPFITFGVTINSEKFNPMLYCMDYFSINKMLEEIINTYIHIFRINISEFCSWAQKALERGDK